MWEDREQTALRGFLKTRLKKKNHVWCSTAEEKSKSLFLSFNQLQKLSCLLMTIHSLKTAWMTLSLSSSKKKRDAKLRMKRMLRPRSLQMQLTTWETSTCLSISNIFNGLLSLNLREQNHLICLVSSPKRNPTAQTRCNLKTRLKLIPNCREKRRITKSR